MKKFFGALLIGAFVFGLGATDTASAAKPEYGSKNPYDSRAYEFGLGSSDQYQNLAKPEYGSKNPYDSRAYEFGLGSSDQYQNLAKPEYGSKNPYDNR